MQFRTAELRNIIEIFEVRSRENHGRFEKNGPNNLSIFEQFLLINKTEKRIMGQIRRLW